jgi:hypothetical protein
MVQSLAPARNIVRQPQCTSTGASRDTTPLAFGRGGSCCPPARAQGVPRWSADDGVAMHRAIPHTIGLRISGRRGGGRVCPERGREGNKTLPYRTRAMWCHGTWAHHPLHLIEAGTGPKAVATGPSGTGTLLPRVSPCVAAGPVPASAEPARRRGSGAVAGGTIEPIPVTRTTSAIGPLPTRSVVLEPPRSPRPRRRRNLGAARAPPRGHRTRGYGRLSGLRGNPTPYFNCVGHRDPLRSVRCYAAGCSSAAILSSLGTSIFLRERMASISTVCSPSALAPSDSRAAATAGASRVARMTVRA